MLLQELPFSIELKKFIVDYYSTGMPKLFASEVVLHDRATGERKAGAHRGQPSGQLEGRRDLPVELRRRRLQREAQGGADGGGRQALRARRHHRRQLAQSPTAPTGLTLEYTALRLINVENFAQDDGAGQRRRRAQGRPARRARIASRRGPTRPTSPRRCATSARASATSCAMRPARRASTRTTWCRSTPATASRCSCWACASSPSEPFRYLRVPADEQASMEGFVRMRAALADAALRRRAVERYVARAADPLSARTGRATCAARPPARWRCSPAPSAPARTPGARAAGRPSPSSWRSTCRAAERERAGTVLVRILNDVLFEVLNLSREQAGLAALAARREVAGVPDAGGAGDQRRPLLPGPGGDDADRLQAGAGQRVPGGARAGQEHRLSRLPVADRRHFCHAVRARAQAVGVAGAATGRTGRRVGHHGAVGRTASRSTATANSSASSTSCWASTKETSP